MYVVTSMHDSNYNELAELTWNQNKKLYCEKHGYIGINWLVGSDRTYPGGWERLKRIRDIMIEHPEYKWFWWTGADAMITNFNVKMEDKIDENFDLIIATDCNEINNDSFLIKNTKWSQDYLQELINLIPRFEKHYFYEQQAMIETIPNHKEKVKIVPQRYLNSYKNDLYPWQSKYDLLGTDGTWQKGDWLIHWPGTGLDVRLQLARHFLNEVVQ